MSVNAGSINNYGTLGSNGNLLLSTPSLLNENGLIFSGGDTALQVNSFTNHSAQLYSFGAVSIGGYGSATQANQVSNISGSLESTGQFNINAANFENRTEGFSLGRKLVSGFIAIKCIRCWGSYYGANIVVRETFEGQDTDTSAAASLSAGGDFTFRGGSFLNSKSTISAGGNIAIQADNVKNVGAVSGTIERTRSYLTGDIDKDIINDFSDAAFNYNARNNPDFPNIYYINDSGGVSRALAVNSTRGGGRDHDQYPVVAFFDAVTGEGVNRFDLPDDLSNLSTKPQSQYDPNNLVALPSQLQSSPLFALTGDVEVAKNGSASGRSAVIQAGGNVSISATQDLTNSVIHQDYGFSAGANKVQTTQVAGTGAPVVVRINAQLPPNLAQQQVNPLALPGFSLPTGQNGLFHLSGQSASAQQGVVLPDWRVVGTPIGLAERQPGATDVQALAAASGGQSLARVQGLPDTSGRTRPQKYLIETNPVLTDLKQFMSSDYLLSNLGYNPDTSAKRLGDGFYEQKLIQQAVVARTGQRFIDGQTSDEKLFKYLMDNAISSKQQLDLSVGVSLTAQQVAALTHDIVWMEKQVVNGEEVLVPVLYLAQATNRLAPNGALIQGADVTLIAGANLENSGTLRASSNLSALAGKDLLNTGLVEASNRLDALASNNIVNQSGGIIAGRDVSVTAVTGDVLNQRDVNRTDQTVGFVSAHRESLDNAARIEAANNLTIKAGRDVSNNGSVLQSGGDTVINAGRDINIAATESRSSTNYGGGVNDSSVTQTAATVNAGHDLQMTAGRDLTVIASQIDAKRDISMAATENLTLGSAADESHFLSKSRRETIQKDHVAQMATTVQAGGDVKLSAGKDLGLIASKVSAGNEAYLVAGDQLDLMSAQNSDYSLYDMKKRGSWGRKKTQHDEVTQVTNVGSEIKTGGNLTLQSGSDQHYQVAKLESGKDLTIESGGAITFEGQKDLHQESHEKTNNNAFWVASKGSGKTDETLRQTQMVAAGNITIKAVQGLKIDLKQVNQQSVSQTIDAMVKADPKMAWLKDAEKRGDVDWHLVKEIHDSYQYSNSGLGPASQLIIAIALAAVMGPMMAGLSTITQAGALTVATKATVSTIDNRGNLGAVLKDVTSKDSLKSYAVSMATAGVAQGLNYNPGSVGFNLQSAQTVALKVAADSVIKTAVYGGSFKDNLASSAAGTAASIGGAIGAGKIGDLGLDNGSLEKTLLHAGLGGLLSKAMGGDFRTGAIAGGANELLVGALGDKLLPENLTPGSAEYIRAEANLKALTQIVAVLGAAASGGDVGIASAVAENATQYNFLGDHSQAERDRARQDFEETKSIDSARKLVTLDGADQRSDDLLAAFHKDPTSLSATDRIELAAYLQVYGYEQALKYGPEAAAASVEMLVKNGPAPVSDYHYAGTTDAKNAYADALRAQQPDLWSQLSWTREQSTNELVYKDAQGYLRINNEQQGLSNIGSPALYAMPGGLGLGIRAAAAVSGTMQAGYGANQVVNGDIWNGIGNIVVGAMGAASLGIPDVRLSSGVGGEVSGAAKGAADVAEVGANTKGPTGTPAWTSSEGPYSGKLSGDYPSGTTTVNGQVVDGVGDFSGELGAKGAAGTIDQAATGIEWGKGIQGQGMPWEDYLASQLPASSRLPPNFKTFDFYDPSTGTAMSAKTLDTTTAAKLANPSQVYNSLKGNIDAAAKFETYTLGNVPLDSSMIAARELRVAVPSGTTSAQWAQINRAVEYGQSQGVKVIISAVK